MYKKVWIIILIIIVTSSLFPSVLIANAEEEEGGIGDIPDREYTFENAPFPGAYGQITEASWQAFINRAGELGHTVIKKYAGTHINLEDGTVRFFPLEGAQIFYSTDGTDLKYEYNTDNWYIHYALKYKDIENTNVLRSWDGHHTGQPHKANNIASGSHAFHPDNKAIGFDSHIAETWYRADVVDDPFQESPEKFNIDPENSYGMWFIKPSQGEWINIPRSLSYFRDWVEIEIQVPREYMPSTGLKETLFEVDGGIERLVRPNFAIKLYSNNVRKIHGSQVVGQDGTWILQKDIKYDAGFLYENDMYGAKFTARVPIEHAKPGDGGSSLIVADLYIYDSKNTSIKYSERIPEARTWVRYLTYVGVVDEDGDGYDDRTGLPIDYGKPDYSQDGERPNINDYDDDILGRISYYWDTFIYYIKMPFVFIGDLIKSIFEWIDETLNTWIDSFILVFERLFSFLPREIVVILGLGFATLMVITIIRAIRGS